ncbi:hypothetical protein Avbf_06248 [Armadillidium vulgare]|nr:hypothetical protein Avbf_06248 [Armadillidium vulgare]
MPYCSPEIIDGGEKKYNPFKADVFSLGVVLFLLTTSVMPFYPFDHKRVKVSTSGRDGLSEFESGIKATVTKYVITESLHKGIIERDSVENTLAFYTHSNHITLLIALANTEILALIE